MTETVSHCAAIGDIDAVGGPVNGERVRAGPTSAVGAWWRQPWVRAALQRAGLITETVLSVKLAA